MPTAQTVPMPPAGWDEVQALSTTTGPSSRAGFVNTFGWLGVPMLLAFVLSAVWTAMLAAIHIAPNAIANTLMRTSEFDFGEFWLLSTPDKTVGVPAIIALCLFAVGYAYLALAMIYPRSLVSQVPFRSVVLLTKSSMTHASLRHKLAQVAKKPKPPKRRVWRKLGLWLIRLGRWIDGKKDTPELAVPKLVLQTTTLITYLREGFPLVVTFSYSGLLLINWFFTGYRFVCTRPDPRMVRTRLFNSFDLFFAVFAPFHVLVNAYQSFSFDRDVFATRLATLTPEHFDRTARLFADPTEISLFIIAFEHLQATTPLRIAIKCTLNGFAIFKWYSVIVYLSSSAQNQMPTASAARVNTLRTANRLVRKRHVRSMSLAFFVCCVGSGIFMYSIVAVIRSHHACSPFVECKVSSYRWDLGEGHCSCIVFIDRETEVKNMTEWEDPPHATDSLAMLAYTGHLKIVQIINRQVPFFPPELRYCRDLKQLILIYTKTLTIPDWAKEFSKLEYLHIEGDVTHKQLTSIPRDLFENMTRLKFLHLGCLLSLPFVPDLEHPTRLEYLALAMLHTVTEIPSLDQLTRLRRLSIVDNVRLLRTPHFRALRSLQTIALSYRTPVCCNGFVSGTCNLTAFACLDRTAQGEPLVECATDHILPEDFRVLMDTKGSVCPPDMPFDLKEIKPTLETTDLACGGVLYKQCSIGSVPGICFPARMQPVSCQVDVAYTIMRRLQIERAIGKVCDPVVEDWLGCRP